MAQIVGKYLFIYRNKNFYFCLDNGNQTHLDLAINKGFQSINSDETFNKSVVLYDSMGYGDGLFLEISVSQETNDVIQRDNPTSMVVDVIVAALTPFSSELASQSLDGGATLTIVTGQFAGPDLS